KDVRPPVIVIVHEGGAAPSCFDNVFLFLLSAGLRLHRQPCLGRDIDEIDLGRGCCCSPYSNYPTVAMDAGHKADTERPQNAEAGVTVPCCWHARFHEAPGIAKAKQVVRQCGIVVCRRRSDVRTVHRKTPNSQILLDRYFEGVLYRATIESDCVTRWL